MVFPNSKRPSFLSGFRTLHCKALLLYVEFKSTTYRLPQQQKALIFIWFYYENLCLVSGGDNLGLDLFSLSPFLLLVDGTTFVYFS